MAATPAEAAELRHVVLFGFMRAASATAAAYPLCLALYLPAARCCSVASVCTRRLLDIACVCVCAREIRCLGSEVFSMVNGKWQR